MNILFLVPYPLKESPSQRFRFEQYLDILRNEGHLIRVQSFLTKDNWRQFSGPGNFSLKVFAVIRGFTRRLMVIPTLPRQDLIFIHRESMPLGPPVLEWLITKIFQKRVIYDFDDALWLTDRKDESLLLKFVKWRSKVSAVCRWSYRISCGNHYLCEYARQFNNNVVYNPTTVDTDIFHVARSIHSHAGETTIIGWTGSYSTLKYLEAIEEVLADVEQTFPQVRFMVIADQEPALELRHLTFKPWNRETEIEDVSQFDIGIMPLPDDEWSKGKCAFKALQYMALQIPTVASAAGVNTTVIDHGVNGFLVRSPGEWKKYLGQLIVYKSLRVQLGREGRKKVIDLYSVRSNSSRFLSLFT